MAAKNKRGKTALEMAAAARRSAAAELLFEAQDFAAERVTGEDGEAREGHSEGEAWGEAGHYQEAAAGQCDPEAAEGGYYDEEGAEEERGYEEGAEGGYYDEEGAEEERGYEEGAEGGYYDGYYDDDGAEASPEPVRYYDEGREALGQTFTEADMVEGSALYSGHDVSWEEEEESQSGIST